MNALVLSTLFLALPQATYGHVSIWHKAMYGFNVTQGDYPYDNRPVSPLMNLPFAKWWFHGHIDKPPNDGDVMSFPAGGTATMEVACNKGLTSEWASSEGHTDIRQPDGNPCPGGDGFSSIHTTSFADVTGCAIGIVDKANVTDIKPQDFAIFTVNVHCPWTTKTDFQVPADMPACTGEYCHCAWFWIHAPDSGGEQMYMNGFRCNVTDVKPTAKKIAQANVARRCGADTVTPKAADPKNCTVGAKQPLYWFQEDGNNMFEGTYAPPEYNPLYGFEDGAQVDIFTDEPGFTGNPPASNAAAAPVVIASGTSSLVVVATTAPAPAPTPTTSSRFVTIRVTSTSTTMTSSAAATTTAGTGPTCKRSTSSSQRKRAIAHAHRAQARTGGWFR